MLNKSYRCYTVTLLACAAMLLGAGRVAASVISKANNSTALNAGGSWVGGNAPGGADIAQWDSTVAGANSSPLGGNGNWQGIKIVNPGGNITIGNTAGMVLSNGAAGIDLSGSSVNLTVACAFHLGSAQSWDVASGRTLTVSGAVNGLGLLTKTGAGVVALSASSNGFAGDIVINNGTLAATVAAVNSANPAVGNGTALGRLDPARTITVNSGGALTFTNSNDVFAQGGTALATPAPLIVVNAGGNLIVGHTSTSETGSGYGNNFGKITLNGGSLRLLKGYSATYGAAMLSDTISVGGSVVSTITSNGMVNSVASLGYSGSPVGTTFDVADVTGDANSDLIVSARLRNAPNFTTGISLTKNGSGTMSLNAANAFTGDTVINAGTLALGVGGTLNSTVLRLNSGATFDVSAQAGSGYSFTTGETLANDSASGTAILNIAGGTMTLSSGALSRFTADGGGSSVGKISVIGNLTLNNNAITVNVTGAPLGAGTYRLQECSGVLSGSANGAPAISGLGLGAFMTATIVTSSGASGSVDLVVAPLCTLPTTSFSMTGGGSYLSTEPGIPVGLSGSQSGVTYQLYTNGVATGQTAAGNGSPVSFGSQTQVGSYTVFSTTSNGYCPVQMTGSPAAVAIGIIHVPRITQSQLGPAGLVLLGDSGPPNGAYEVRFATNLAVPSAAWTIINPTNYFDATGNFSSTNEYLAQHGTGFYRVRVVTDAPVRPVPPTITAQPQDQYVGPGQTATFSVTAVGAMPMSYQWYYNTNTLLNNQTNATLTLANVQTNQAGAYSVIVSNYLGATNSVFATLDVMSEAAFKRPRIIVTTDGEVDDRSSMVRFLLYTCDFDVAGIVQVNSRYQKNGHSVDQWIEAELDRYEQVRTNLIIHNPNYPTADYLRSVVYVGNENINDLFVPPPNMATTNTPGEQFIIQTLLDNDPRPVHVPSWGGANTTASALWRLKYSGEYNTEQFNKAVSKILIYCIWYQDDGGGWIQTNITEAYINEAYRWDNVWDYQSVGGSSQNPLNYTGSDAHLIFPTGSENTNNIQYYMSNAWLTANVKTGHGPLGAYTPQTYISEGDTPSFLHLINNGLEADKDYTLGGWGGRSVFGPNTNLHPNHMTDKDTAITDDGNVNKMYWRWIPAAQNDFAARMDWCVATSYAAANHQPVARVAGSLVRDVAPGQTVTLDATPSSDPDGNTLIFNWWQYADVDSSTNKVTIANSSSMNNASFIVPAAVNQIGKQMHIILQVTDNGAPPLTSYQRIICNIK